MKLVYISTQDIGGGAPIACYRTAKALESAGVDIKIAVRDKLSEDPIAIHMNQGFFGKMRREFNFIGERLAYLPHEASKDVRFVFSVARFGQNIAKHPAIQQADILNLHWINFGYMSLKSIEQLSKLGKPILFTLHDMWAFTGGCHYAGDCVAYQKACGNCWYVKHPKPNDLSSKIWKRKQALLSKMDFQVITSSEWLRDCAKSSSLFQGKKVTALPTPVNMNIFSPKNMDVQREKLLGPDHKEKKLLFFISMNVADKRKGFEYLRQSVHVLHDKLKVSKEKVEILVAGKANKEILEQLPYKINYLGLLKGEEAIADAYNMADVFVMPSLEDNLPNTVIESLGCSTPVVAFNAGGLPEMIDHHQNGYIADFKDVGDFANGIQWILEHDNPERLAASARERALAHYAPEVIAQQHLQFYKDNYPDLF